MGNTQKTGNYVNAIFQDTSNNIGIGGSPSGSYKLEVTGTAKVSSTLLVSANVGINTTLPSGIVNGTGLVVYDTNYPRVILQNSTTGTGTGAYSGLFSIGSDIYFVNSSATGKLYFSVNSSSQAMTVTSAGDVIIGNTTNPYSEKFSVYGAKSRTAGLPTSQLSIMDTTAYATGVGGAVNFGGYYNATDYTGWASIEGNKENATSGDYGGYLGFYTRVMGGSNTERMRITSGGNVLIGQTNDTGGKLILNNIGTGVHGVEVNLPNSYSSVAYVSSTITTASTSFYHFIGQSGNGSSITTNNILIYGTGTILNGTGTYGTISDISLKENIIDATPKLENILKLKVKNFNFINDESKIKQIGFIAQEFEEIFPNMVDIDPKSEKKYIKTSILIPILVKAIQELNERLNKAGL